MASATPGRTPVWAVPLSLAATDGIDVSFYSCGYLDVSVPRVSSYSPIHSASSNTLLQVLCFHIQKSPDQCLFASFPELIAGCRVFLRLSMPRHPPYTLGKLDLLDRGSTRRCRLKVCTTNHSCFTRRSTSPTGARAMPAQTERPYVKTIFQKQASQKSLILTRTSYLIVKEHALRHISISRFGVKATRQARVSASSADDRLTQA
jgi:hypothetical protein